MAASVFTSAYEQLVAALVAMRKQAGLSQRDLAALVGREQNYIGRIETRQRRIDLVEMIQICRACGVDPEAEIARVVGRIVSSVPHRRRKEPPQR